MHPFSSGAYYLNYLGEQGENTIKAAFRLNYDRSWPSRRSTTLRTSSPGLPPLMRVIGSCPCNRYCGFLLTTTSIASSNPCKNVGYWEANLNGLAHPGGVDRAELLVDYLGLSEAQILKGADRLSADGKYEMAADLIKSAEAKFPGSGSLKRAKRFAYLKLMEKNQNTDPFKFIIYSGKISEQTPQINPQNVR
jgi:hypothetical protein